MPPVTADSQPTILIIEDGDEYLRALDQTLRGPRFLQAHDWAQASELLAREPVDHIFLDMRFDRIEARRLLGDNAQTHEIYAPASKELLTFLQDNQGLFILDALADSAHATIPVLLFYDFTGQQQRYERLKRRHPALQWVGENAHLDQILQKMSPPKA